MFHTDGIGTVGGKASHRNDSDKISVDDASPALAYL